MSFRSLSRTFTTISKIVITALLLMWLTGCGPVYQTNYQYVPPKSKRMRMCVTRCQTNLNICQSTCQRRQDSCKDRQQRYQEDEARYERHHHHHNGGGNDFGPSFSDDNQCNMNCGCRPQYNQCYQDCGGKVITSRQCVAFCDQK